MNFFLSDFDGTLVDRDILDVICGIVGKEEESRKLNQDFINGKLEGLPTLKKRIDFLQGVSVEDIYRKLDKNNYLIHGAKELFAFLRSKNIVTILHSGNIIPVLRYYQEILGITHVVGTHPRMDGNVIDGIDLQGFGSKTFKVDGCKKIISEYGSSAGNVIALGDSPSDLDIFSISKVSISINPKGGIDNNVDFTVRESLLEVISIISNF